MIRLMLLVQEPRGFRVDILMLAPWTFDEPVDVELYVFSGEGGVARLPLWDGRVVPVRRDDVEAVCAWEEG